jgi:hypothetical protein
VRFVVAIPDHPAGQSRQKFLSREQRLAFNRDLRSGKLKHLDYDSESKKLVVSAPRPTTMPRT